MNTTGKIVLAALGISAIGIGIYAYKKYKSYSPPEQTTPSPRGEAVKTSYADKFKAFTNPFDKPAGREVAANGLQDIGVAPEAHNYKRSATAISVGAPLILTGY